MRMSCVGIDKILMSVSSSMIPLACSLLNFQLEMFWEKQATSKIDTALQTVNISDEILSSSVAPYILNVRKNCCHGIGNKSTVKETVGTCESGYRVALAAQSRQKTTRHNTNAVARSTDVQSSKNGVNAIPLITMIRP